MHEKKRQVSFFPNELSDNLLEIGCVFGKIVVSHREPSLKYVNLKMGWTYGNEKFPYVHINVYNFKNGTCITNKTTNKFIAAQNLHIVFSNFRSNITTEKRFLKKATSVKQEESAQKARRQKIERRKQE